MAKSTLLTSLETFLSGATDSESFHFDVSQIEGISSDGAKEITALIEGLDRAKFTFERKDGGGLFKKTRMASIYEGGKEDARTSKESSADPANPFRPRYRKLSPPETAFHDDLKNEAFAFMSMIDHIPQVRTHAGLDSPGPTVQRDLALARTHLEDAVMRAVRALTA